MSCYIRPHAIPSHPSHANFTPFNPLLSFLEDFATQFAPENANATPAHRQQRGTSSSSANSNTKKTEKKHASPTPSYTPRFDILEKDDAYELYGELPGVKVEDVRVEFSDEKTLVIAGSSARFAASVTPSTTAVSASENAAASTTDPETTSLKGKEKAHQHQAAVEDADDFEDLSTTSAAATPDSTVAPDPEFQSLEDLDATASATNTTTQQPEHKFLLSERKYGTFERTFQFQLPVEKEEVSARLRDGVLSVKVPKRVVRAQKVRVSVD